jgi:hypothetical protein
VTLRSLKAELDGRDAKLRDKAIRTEIDASCKESGVPLSARPFLKAYIREQYGANLTVAEDDAVVFTDEFGEKKPFSELWKAVLQSPGGLTFQPPTSTPGAVGSRTKYGVTSGSSPGQKPIEAWTVEDYQKNPEAGVTALRAAYRRQQGM